MPLPPVSPAVFRPSGPRSPARVLLVIRTRHEAAAAALKGVAQYESNRARWTVFLDDEGRTEHDQHWLYTQCWDGVLSCHTSAALVGACAQRGIPLVDLDDSPPYRGVCKIRPDNEAVGALAADHFIDRGFRHFAFAGFGNASWSSERRAGFSSAVQRAGYHCAVFDCDYPGEDTPEWHLRQRVELAEWIRSLPKPVAILACHDLRGQQLLEATAHAGFSAPDDVAVLGVNNETLRCELTTPALSSVALNPLEAGRRAAECLDRMIAGDPLPACDLRIRPAGVVSRKSTDHLAVANRGVAAAMKFIHEHACRGITVDDVLPVAAMSRAQLEKQFRRHLQRTPHMEIRRVQLARICQLLTETDHPLKQIADLTGFEYVEYMTVLIKRMTGVCPSVYRQQRQAAPAAELPGPSVAWRQTGDEPAAERVAVS